jgi:hypothetical protein
MPIAIFISTVSDEFRAYRDQLEGDLTRHNVAVKVQEHFKDLGGDTLDKLDVYIADCDGVVHLVGHMTGSAADQRQQQALLGKHLDLSQRLPPLGEALRSGALLAYTQWEAWLALYHCKPLMIAKAGETAPREASYTPTENSRAAQAAHLARLKDFGRHAGCEFTSPDHLAKHIFSTAVLDLLIEDYAKQSAREREIAEGFIREMAKRVAGDKALDLDSMKQAVRNAIEIYKNEISGRPLETNLDEIVGRALARAKEQVDRGQSALARTTLRRAAQEMKHREEERRRDEEERRERYLAGVNALYNQARDIALATYDGDAAADAVVELACAIHGANTTKVAEFLDSEAQALYEYGRDRGSNVHLVVAIALRREQLALAGTAKERGSARKNLGDALVGRGERESGTARLEEGVSAYRAALDEYTRERAPLDWARTQHSLGFALWRLGERQKGTEKLEQAVAAFSAALEERTHERVPLEWAQTQNSFGSALRALGEREGGTARLEEAVAAFRAALEERTRDRVPLDWATTQNNLGNALRRLGEWESGTARLKEAILAFRAALEKRTRERVPLDWASTQNNLGVALFRLGERESGTARLEEAVAAYRAALEERTRERLPLEWAGSLGNEGVAMMLIADRSNDGALAEAAAQQIEIAYETLRDGGHEAWAAYYQEQLPKAQAIRDRLKRE